MRCNKVEMFVPTSLTGTGHDSSLRSVIGAAIGFGVVRMSGGEGHIMNSVETITGRREGTTRRGF